MLHERGILCGMILAGAFLLPVDFVAADGSTFPEHSSIRPALAVNPLTSDFKFDGKREEAAWWATGAVIENLVTIEPKEGGVPAGRTMIKVLADQDYIVVVVRCDDNDPQDIVSFSKARDAKLEDEDHVLLVLDTFLDGRSGYVFAVNPTGARFDGLVVEQGEDVNSDWDTVWEAKTSQDDTGWYAEIRIPIKSLGFKKNLTDWGFNIQRRVQRLQETSRWSGVRRDHKIYQIGQAGLLTDLPQFDLGMGLSIRPSFVVTAARPGSTDKLDYDEDISLDITQRLGPNLLSALTINTDFAETEVDVRQINLTRFPLFFPEKRSFFLQGADIFEFGLGLDEDMLIPFYSRRIGLLSRSEIPINIGGKVNGRVNNTNMGALVVNTRQEDGFDVGDDATVDVPETTMGAVRISQNVLRESSVGLLATFGDQLKRSNSWLAGVDFTYKTSRFLQDKNLLIGVWGLLNDREDLNGDKSSVGFRVDYPNDLVEFSLTSIRIGDGFDPSLSFVPRNDTHLWELDVEYNPRPDWPWIRQTFYEVELKLFNDRDSNRWESYELAIKPIDWLFESGDQLEFSIEPQGDRPPEIFDVSDDADIPAGSYEWIRYVLSMSTAKKRRVMGEIKLETGSYYNGDLNTIEAKLTFKPSAFFTLELTAERSDGEVRALVSKGTSDELAKTSFTEELYGVRFQLDISPNLQFSSFTQYEKPGRELISNNKLRWSFDAHGDIFVVYNHNLVRTSDDSWKLVSYEVPVKIQYVFRY